LLALTNLHVVLSQKMVLFIDTLVRTSHLIHIHENDQQYALFLNLFQLNCPLHVSNKYLFIIRRLFLYTQHIVFFHASLGCLATNTPIDAWKNNICIVYRNNLLMMNKYLFETCRGQFNWNKLMRKSVHLVGHSYVYVSQCTVQRV